MGGGGCYYTWSCFLFRLLLGYRNTIDFCILTLRPAVLQHSFSSSNRCVWFTSDVPNARSCCLWIEIVTLLPFQSECLVFLFLAKPPWPARPVQCFVCTQVARTDTVFFLISGKACSLPLLSTIVAVGQCKYRHALVLVHFKTDPALYSSRFDEKKLQALGASGLTASARTCMSHNAAPQDKVLHHFVLLGFGIRHEFRNKLMSVYLKWERTKVGSACFC